MCFRVDLQTAAHVLFAFRLKLYHGTPRALLHPRFQDPMESKQQPDMVPSWWLLLPKCVLCGLCPGTAQWMCLTASWEWPG